ncbi:uncharacterized protein NECHADRAFT_77338 [Fusarium vanettenii 77-13-4]|uniref:Uncharacterized protein n=1 Tax=Fusarium vanettenii (strain ATCC MYA-4622 / CBS 123669 / FGSC 9596 / NRRL 45880 / 77-13-4) TaxID=660122 RepID=C7YKY5_FUSV7|nr:uncharacterized protein NECHADRAFT_77338 [Fusarium vanettenii 77-13-4]EEU46701.1 predicted protein [Fusarium vanettenii 77-13-4]
MASVWPGYFTTHKIPIEWIYDQKVFTDALTKIYGPNYMLTWGPALMTVDTTQREPEKLKQKLVDEDIIRDPSCKCTNCQRMIQELKPKEPEVTGEASGSNQGTR